MLIVFQDQKGISTKVLNSKLRVLEEERIRAEVATPGLKQLKIEYANDVHEIAEKQLASKGEL